MSRLKATKALSKCNEREKKLLVDEKIMSYHCQIIQPVGAYLRSYLQQTSVLRTLSETHCQRLGSYYCDTIQNNIMRPEEIVRGKEKGKSARDMEMRSRIQP